MAGRPAQLSGEVEADVVVLGGGLAGLAAAVAVARPNRKVVVVEGASIGAGSSGADLGHVPTGLGLPYLRAAERFGRERARALWEWHRESHRELVALLEQTGDDCGYRCQGGFLLAHDRAEALDLADSEDALRDDGFPGEFLDHYMLESRFQVRGFSGAYWAADDGELDAMALLRRLAARAEAQGTWIFEACRVEELSVAPGSVVARTARGRVRASFGVIALGAAAGKLLPDLAPRLFSCGARRLAFDLESGASVPSPGRTVAGTLGWRAERDLRAAAFGEPETDSDAGFEALARAVVERMPARPQARGRWSGLIHTGPDGLPLVGECAGSSLFAILGLGTLGHAWAFAAARRAADCLDGRPATASPLSPPDETATGTSAD